jgi:hypothetical protein
MFQDQRNVANTKPNERVIVVIEEDENFVETECCLLDKYFFL